jgi:hypothetical protein
VRKNFFFEKKEAKNFFAPLRAVLEPLEIKPPAARGADEAPCFE